MPYSDALAYFHGTGASSGPITATAVTLTGVSQALTTLTYTVATGQVIPGQTFTLAGGAPTVTNTVTIVAILTGAGSSGTATVNVSQTVTTTTANGPFIMGDLLGAAGTQYCNLELDFGAPSNGAGFPWLPQFPSLTQKGYTFPAEVNGPGGVDLGVHILVTSPFNMLTSLAFNVVSAATTAATTPVIASRSFTLAQLQVTGAHYFIPVMTFQVLEFLRCSAAVTGSNPTFGTITSYWGPRTGGEQ